VEEESSATLKIQVYIILQVAMHNDKIQLQTQMLCFKPYQNIRSQSEYRTAFVYLTVLDPIFLLCATLTVLASVFSMAQYKKKGSSWYAIEYSSHHLYSFKYTHLPKGSSVYKKECFVGTLEPYPHYEHVTFCGEFLSDHRIDVFG